MRIMKGINLNSQLVREKKKKKRQRKQSHTQDNIYVVQQFAYVHKVARISLLLGKNTKMRLQYFLSIYKNMATTPTIKP